MARLRSASPPRLFLAIAAAQIALAAGCSVAQYESQTPNADVIRTQLDKLLGNLHEQGAFGGAVVVGNKREIVWEKGFGYANLERQTRFTSGTPADGASLAKTFTAAMVLALEREGRLTLDEPIQRWLPELPYAGITWRHLLSHSSGLPVADYDYFDKFLPRNEVRTTDSLLRVLAAEKPTLAFEPGSAFEYSSFGYDVAALGVARVTRSSYGELLNARAFGPLGIRSAFVRPGRLNDFPGVRTLGYRREHGTLVLNDVFDLEGFHGGSNVYISARDLHLWNISFLDKPSETAAAPDEGLQFARIGNAPSGLTLANWYRSADGSTFWYSGHLQGFHSEVFRDLRGPWSIVYVSNNTVTPWMQKGLVRAIRSVLAGGEPSLTEPPTSDIGRGDYETLNGRWLMADGDTVTIEQSSGHLTYGWNGVRYRMIQIDPRAFYVPGADVIVGFARETAGTPARLYVSSNLSERWAERTTT